MLFLPDKRGWIIKCCYQELKAQMEQQEEAFPGESGDFKPENSPQGGSRKLLWGVFMYFPFKNIKLVFWPGFSWPSATAFFIYLVLFLFFFYKKIGLKIFYYKIWNVFWTRKALKFSLILINSRPAGCTRVTHFYLDFLFFFLVSTLTPV